MDVNVLVIPINIYVCIRYANKNKCVYFTSYSCIMK